MELPPKIFNEMEGELIEAIDGQSLTAKFPVKECYSNPYGFMQGGMVVAAMAFSSSSLSIIRRKTNRE